MRVAIASFDTTTLHQMVINQSLQRSVRQFGAAFAARRRRHLATVATSTAGETDKLSAHSTTCGAKAFADIPSGRRLPLVGTKLAFLLAGAGKKLHTYIDGRHRALGPIVREALGPADIVFVSCPKAMRDLFKYEGKYPKHPLPESWTMYNAQHNCKRGLFFMDDDEWLHNRKIMNTLLLQADSQQPIRDVIRQSCDDYVADLRTLLQHNPPGDNVTPVEVPDLIQSLYAWSVHGVAGVVLGDIATGPQLRPLLADLSAVLHRLFEDSAPLMTVPPQLAQLLSLKVWTDFERTVTDIMRLAERIASIALDELRARTDGSEEGNMIGGMVRQGMTEEVIKRIFIDLILAAGDTTAYTMQWALYELARNGQAQRSVRTDCLENGTLESTLIRGTVRETMRMYPMAFFIGRLMSVDAVIAGFEIPKNTMVLASLYTAGRSNVNFPAANLFQPERWTRMASSGKLKSVCQPGASIPYALGARSCIGQKVANMQMHYLLSSILRQFELTSLNEGDVDVDIKMVMVPSEKIQIGIRAV